MADPEWREERQGAMLDLINPRGLTRSGLIEDALAATIGA